MPKMNTYILLLLVCAYPKKGAVVMSETYPIDVELSNI